MFYVSLVETKCMFVEIPDTYMSIAVESMEKKLFDYWLVSTDHK